MRFAAARSLCVALVIACLGCALSPGGVGRDIARAAPPAAINSTLRALNEQDNQRLVNQLLRSPEVHAATRAFAAEIADGALDTLTSEQRMARIESMSSRLVATITRAALTGVADGLRRDLGPAMAVVMREAIATSMREALSAGYQRDLERVATGLTRATVDAATRGVAEGIARDFGPAMRATLLDPQTVASIGDASRVLARGAVLGSNDAMAQIQAAQERGGRTSVLGRLTSLTEKGVKVVELVAAAAVAASILLALWVLRLILRGRRIQAESEQHAASAVMFAEALRAAEGKPWADELTALLRERLKRESIGEMIDDVLASKPPSGSRARMDRLPTAPPPPHAHHA